MNPIPASLLIGVLVTLRKWSNGEQISIENVLGVAGTAVVLGVLAAINRDLARAFGALAVLAVALAHVPTIFERAGFSQRGISNTGGGGSRNVRVR